MSDKPGVSYDKAFVIQAPRPKVFDALTQARHLEKWFAEHVSIDLRVGGDFRFWGKHTFLVPNEESANQKITRVQPPGLLGFSWMWDGVPGEVTLELADAPDWTSLRIRHTLERDMPSFEYESVHVVTDYWRTMVGNLHGYLANGSAMLRPDYSARSGIVTLSIEIDAPPELIMQALTVPAQMNQWVAKNATVELRKGGVYSYGWTTTRDGKTASAGPHTLLEYIANRRLTHDWTYHNEDRTRVTWELTALPGNRTRVTLTHDRFDQPKMWAGYVQGWASFLVELRQFSEAALSNHAKEIARQTS